MKNGFESMVIFTAPVFWLFFCLVGFSLIILRYKDPKTERPYRTFGYPLTPIVFCAMCLFMFYSSLNYAVSNSSYEAFWSIAIILIGLLVGFINILKVGQTPPK